VPVVWLTRFISLSLNGVFRTRFVSDYRLVITEQTPLIGLILWLNCYPLWPMGKKSTRRLFRPSRLGHDLDRTGDRQLFPAWIRSNGFILGLFGVVILAFLFPQPGARNGWLHPDLISDFGIALILFFQGLSMPLEKVWRGAGNWRLHVIIQVFTFVIFPIVGLGFQTLLAHLWADETEAVKQGFLYLCVLPSTVSTSVVLTSVAGGNTAAAVLSAAFSNIIGVILTPLLVSFLMHATGHGRPIGPLLIQITMLTLLPFAAGVILRRFVQHWVDANKRWTNPISNGVILFIVYTAFCDSVTERIWNKYGVILTVEVLLIVVCLFGTISLLIYLASRAARLNREDAIAVYFCSVKKTLAMGVPLAMLIFGSRADLSLILLPIMFYHPFQLLVNGLLANHWASQRTTANDNEHQRTTVNSKRHSAG
jgi:solute carrier family 10 (sodium/bile acid cotransporter), member 7